MATWTDGFVPTEIGDVPRARTALGLVDRLGTYKARWGVGRMDYRVPPGLQAVGTPNGESPVLVCANYKMSFDRLRSALSGRSAWLLVLDTDGVNVWCAAGKGTFGTDEIVRRAESAKLARLVSHRTLVVPQLGAPGVCAHEVRQRSGFRVVYGPIRAEDLPAFLDAGMKATPEMRQVRFRFLDRIVLIPVELTMGAIPPLLAAAVLTLVGGLGPTGFSLTNLREVGLPSGAMVLATFLCATVLGPALLPWLPGRAFSVKGAILGLLLAAVALATQHLPGLHAAAWVMMIPALSSFVVMNFTGASTFTSLSGVKAEMRIALPAQVSMAALAMALWLAGLFLGKGVQ